MNIRFTVEGDKLVEKKLRAIDPKATIFLKRQVNAASTVLRTQIQQDLIAGTWGVKSRHGTAGLAGSVHEIEAAETATGIEGGVGGAAPPFQYGAMLEKGGTGPYEIVGNPVLAWPAFEIFQRHTSQRRFAFTADMIFAKRVQHPALKKSPWFTGPLQEMRDKITALLTPDPRKDLF